MAPNYYQWDGGWGYPWFDDLKLYYDHGRRWSSEIGIDLTTGD